MSVVEVVSTDENRQHTRSGESCCSVVLVCRGRGKDNTDGLALLLEVRDFVA